MVSLQFHVLTSFSQTYGEPYQFQVLTSYNLTVTYGLALLTSYYQTYGEPSLPCVNVFQPDLW